MAAAIISIRPSVAIPSLETQLRPRQPTCQNCNRPAVLRKTSWGNPNGNAGRPYFVCPTCRRESRWVCWADTRGIAPTNPRCECGRPSRQDRIGSDKGVKTGRGFWTCSAGNCGFYSENEDGTSGASDDGFHPWSLTSSCLAS